MYKLLSLNAKRAREKSQRLRAELKKYEKQYDRIFHKHLKSKYDGIQRESDTLLSNMFESC